MNKSLLKLRLTQFFITAILVISCKGSDNESLGQIKTFDLKELPELTTVKLSDLGMTEIEYIPLETNAQSVFSFSDNVFLTWPPPIDLIIGEKFYIIRQNKTIIKFHEDGTFEKIIGKFGRGPGEYTVAHDIEYNGEDHNIYIVSGWDNKFDVYSKSGEFVRSFNIPLYAAIDFIIIDNSILCYCENHMGNIENSYTLLDTCGIVIKTFPNKFAFKNHDAFVVRSENLFYKFKNQVFKKEVYSDTIYVYENLNFKPHLVIELGKKLITPEVRSMYIGRDIAKNYIQQLNLFEFGDYIYFDFIYKFTVPDELITYSFIGSKTGNYQVLFNRSEGIINDLDGGPSILPRSIKDDNTIIALLDVAELKSHIASETFKNSNPKYPNKKIKLVELSNKLKETDNPVLVLAKIK
jgi:hypothetical protein